MSPVHQRPTLMIDRNTSSGVRSTVNDVVKSTSASQVHSNRSVAMNISQPRGCVKGCTVVRCGCRTAARHINNSETPDALRKSPHVWDKPSAARGEVPVAVAQSGGQRAFLQP